MASYTLELNKLDRDNYFCIFDFDYDFYDNLMKANFERKFIDHYYFYEIGFETIERFKHSLKTRLNEIYPKYKQLYETEIKAKEINFLLNKDLKEKYTRQITKDGKVDNITNSINDVIEKTTTNNQNDFKESNINNGNADLSLNSLTSLNNTIDETTNDSTSNNTSNSTSNIETNDNEIEVFENLSQGNIGITSSAELLQKWRDTIINIDQLIIRELNDLFMGVF